MDFVEQQVEVLWVGLYVGRLCHGLVHAWPHKLDSTHIMPPD